ncbi:MAG: DUF4297 domain-containing protein [Betaproteobacteria bacterium]|jgi:Cap4 dsDNA endonuclease|nr:DUF4297 domain-containing protein [Betaproteobacteria bacterium]NBP45563.1 DUF4297 domain-containing protein [Betaproteobacteria bacterium]
MQGHTPETVLATGDPGDDVALRFRYQWTYAAIVCCMLLDESQECAEVFCEHHEDILVKLTSGRFRGLQIKTRDGSQAPWKSSDAAVRSSLARFCRLEQNFPGHFEGYRFLTNHQLHPSANSQDVRNVLREMRAVDEPRLLAQKTQRYLQSIANEAGCDESLALTALRKAEADDTLPKLADIEVRLISTLAENWHRSEDLVNKTVARAARRLWMECCRAASLAHLDVLPAYIPASATPTTSANTALISGKRFDSARLKQVLDDGVAGTLPLEGDLASLTLPGTGNRSLLQKKLEAGGFSVVSQNSAEDLRSKAEYLGFTWMQRFGRENGLQRYTHIRSVVLSDAATAFEAAKAQANPFGSLMLGELRERFRERRRDGVQLYECSGEHLEGVAFELTAECQVQWSIDRPWEEE